MIAAPSFCKFILFFVNGPHVAESLEVRGVMYGGVGIMLKCLIILLFIHVHLGHFETFVGLLLTLFAGLPSDGPEVRFMLRSRPFGKLSNHNI